MLFRSDDEPSRVSVSHCTLESQSKVASDVSGPSIADILDLLEECFQAGVQPEEVDSMLHILDGGRIPFEAQAFKEATQTTVQPFIMEDHDELGDWNAVQMTESCRLETSE